MTGSLWWDMAIGVAAAVMLTWVALVIGLAVLRPRGGLLQEALGVMPDTLRLIRRLAADRNLPRGVRVRLALLLVYLAIPIDPIPDFIPVLGYADDAIVVTACCAARPPRRCRRRPTHWPGTDDGFTALRRITGLTTQTPAIEYENPDTTAR